jgi:hypothetical protein
VKCVVAILALGATGVQGADWPQFRGPGGQGHSTATNLPIQWSESDNVAWKTPIPGRGWSSPVICEDRIWVTTATDVAASEADKEQRLEVNTGGQPLHVSDFVVFRAICVDRSDGRILHDVELMSQKDPQWIHQLNSYASPTPVIDDERVYCHFGTFGTVCVDSGSGKVLWRNRSLPVMHENGPGSSPILWRDLVIFHCDGSDVQFVAALNKKTGELAWKTPRSGKMDEDPQKKKAFGTPLVVNAMGQDQLLSTGANWLYSYDPATGRELWKVHYGALGFSISPRPVAGDGIIYLSTCFERSELLAIRFDDPSDRRVVWRFSKAVPRMSSPLLVEEKIYSASDMGGIVACLDARSGATHWRGRLGGNHAASPLYADGRIFFFSREGETVVLSPGDDFQVLSRNKLDGSFMASAAAVDRELYLRTDKALYRVEDLNH